MTDQYEGSSLDQRSRAPWWAWSSLFFAGVILILIRLHAFDLPLETDEANYAYIGARLLEGDRLYIDVWDHQPPGVFILFAGAIAFFGDEPTVFRWMACGFSLATLIIIFLVLQRIAVFGTKVHTSGGALIATGLGATLFAIVSADPGSAGEGCQREIYMNTLILLAWYAAIRATEKPDSWHGREPAAQDASTRRWAGWWILAGASLGVASVFKTIVAVHWLFLTLWMLFSVSSQKRHSTAPHPTELGSAVHVDGWTTRWIALGVLSVGPILIWVSTIAYFAVTGRGHEFIDAVFVFNLGYSGDAGLLARGLGFFTPDRHPFIFDSAMPLWITGALATLWLAYDGLARRNSQALLILALVLAGYATVCLPGRFWPHYYYLMIPPLVIAVSYAVVSLSAIICIPNVTITAASSVRFAVLTVLGIIVAGASLWTQYRDYLSQPPFGITVKRYNSRDFWGRGQGENVSRVTEPDDTIFVYGNDASIYYYARRRCASRFTMITGLAEGMPGAQRRRAILMEELRDNMPRLILVLFDYEPFDEWRAFLHEHYTEPIGWDLHDRTQQPIMFVVARKDAPVIPIGWDWDRSSVGGWFIDER